MSEADVERLERLQRRMAELQAEIRQADPNLSNVAVDYLASKQAAKASAAEFQRELAHFDAMQDGSIVPTSKREPATAWRAGSEQRPSDSR